MSDPGRPLSALIVEDSEDDLALLLRQLRHHGFAVDHEQVDNAEDMEAALSGQTWDVVLSDYCLPHFSGPLALALARRLAGDVPFIIVSGVIGEEAAVEMMLAGADDFVMKGNWRRLIIAIEREIREAGQRAARREAEQALRQTEARMASIVASATDAIISIGADQRVTSFNRAAEEMFGYPPEVAIGMLASHFVPERRRTGHAEHAGAVIQHERGNFPVRITSDAVGLRASGEEFPVELSISRFETDTEPQFTIIVRDVTERRRAEADLARRARAMAALYDTALEINSQRDLNALLPAVAARAADLIGTHLCALYLMHENGNSLTMAVGHNIAPSYLGIRVELGRGVAGQVAVTGEPLALADYSTWEGRAGGFYHDPLRRVVGVPLKVGDRIIGVLTVADDERTGTFAEDDVRLATLFANQAAIAIENVRLYQEVQSYAAELEERVAERTAELSQRESALSDTAARLQQANASLEAAAHELRRLNDFKSEFVSNVSHELRTPLNNIKLYLGLLENGKPEKRAQYYATLNREAEILKCIIEDLLQLSRLDLGTAQPRLAAVDVNDLLASLVDDRQHLVAQHGLTIETRLDPALPAVMADARMLVQVVSNLLTNAMSYTQAGGHIVAGTALGQPGGAADSGAYLYVADNGPGIAAKELDHVFERFYRGDAARKTQAPGTGLGLAICQEIIRRHGGQITVQSQPGQGSTFTVWLPGKMPAGA